MPTKPLGDEKGMCGGKVNDNHQNNGVGMTIILMTILLTMTTTTKKKKKKKKKKK